jgi:hypothetical protein
MNAKALLLAAVLSMATTMAHAQYVGGPPWGLRLPPFAYGPPRPPIYYGPPRYFGPPMAYAPLPVPLPVPFPAPPLVPAPETCLVDPADPTPTMLNVRASPNGWPVGLLSNGTQVILGGEIAGNWVTIVFPVSGWVFGPLLACPSLSPQTQARPPSGEPPADQYKPPVAGTRPPVPGAPFERTPADDGK